MEENRIDPDLYKRAIELAARVHAPHKVPGSNHPYVVHVVKVATEVIAATEGDGTLDRDLAMACAVLHDTVEDAEPPERPGILSEIRRDFGQAVADGVLALSKDDALPKAERMPDSLRRIREQPREVWLVKLADRITNLEPPPPTWTPEKCRTYLAEAAGILAALGEASPVLRRRFERKMAEYEAHCR